MSTLQLTKTRLKEGVWQGIITGMGEDEPLIEVTHDGQVLKDVLMTHNQSADHWTLSIPIPPQAIADGVQTVMIRDRSADVKIGHITLMAGDELAEDLRAEVNLLRAELDMLKSAFRRHCLETS